MAAIKDFANASLPIITIINDINNVAFGGLDLQPKYQRGYIWSNDFKDKLLYSIIKNYPIGGISLRELPENEKNSKGATKEVVDGQQRLTTIYKFVTGEYEINSGVAREIINFIVEYLGDSKDKKLEKLKKRLGNKGKISLGFKQLPDNIQMNINSYNLAIIKISKTSDDEITEYFRYLQNQERLRAGEILNSIPDTSLEKYLSAITDRELLLSKIAFQNDRKQFDRAFYSVLGLVDGQVRFGVRDKDIMKFVEGCSELKEDTVKRADYLVSELNAIIADKAISNHFITCNVRSMKFLLLLILFKLVNFSENRKEKLKALEAIDKKISAFNSAKPDSIESAFNGYSGEVIQEHQLLALIAKGAHPLNRVKNRMEILAYYVNHFDNKIKPSGIIPN